MHIQHPLPSGLDPGSWKLGYIKGPAPRPPAGSVAYEDVYESTGSAAGVAAPDKIGVGAAAAAPAKVDVLRNETSPPCSRFSRAVGFHRTRGKDER